MRTVEWYYDVVSPYAYLQVERLDGLAADLDLVLRPVLFAGLLARWGQLGPAEIEPKRRFTYRHAIWLAERQGVPFRMPPGHPFNPLRLLRLAVALGDDLPAVRAVFRYVWAEGGDPHDERATGRLAERLGIDPARIEDPDVKATLRAHGERAVAAGVFGVPTLVTAGEPFWGQDAIEMVRATLADPDRWRRGACAGLADLPVLAARPR